MISLLPLLGRGIWFLLIIYRQALLLSFFEYNPSLAYKIAFFLLQVHIWNRGSLSAMVGWWSQKIVGMFGWDIWQTVLLHYMLFSNCPKYRCVRIYGFWAFSRLYFFKSYLYCGKSFTIKYSMFYSFQEKSADCLEISKNLYKVKSELKYLTKNYCMDYYFVNGGNGMYKRWLTPSWLFGCI